MAHWNADVWIVISAKSFKKTRISNVMYGTEGDLIWKDESDDENESTASGIESNSRNNEN